MELEKNKDIDCRNQDNLQDYLTRITIYIFHYTQIIIIGIKLCSTCNQEYRILF